jgi:hypothetical protein
MVAIVRPEVAMAAAVPLRTDFDAARLRALAKQSRDPDQTRRLLALAAIDDGASRTKAAQIGCVTLQIVREWVLRFTPGHLGLLDSMLILSVIPIQNEPVRSGRIRMTAQ